MSRVQWALFALRSGRPTYVTKETYMYDQRDSNLCSKKPTHMTKETTHMTEETYVYDKRDLHIWKKRTIYMTKETNVCDKRDLHTWQKRLSFFFGWETYVYNQWDLYIQAKWVEIQWGLFALRLGLPNMSKETNWYTKRPIDTKTDWQREALILFDTMGWLQLVGSMKL